MSHLSVMIVCIVNDASCGPYAMIRQYNVFYSILLYSNAKDLIWNVICFFFLIFLCMTCYLQLHNARLSSLFLCVFLFFFFLGVKFGKQIFFDIFTSHIFKRLFIFNFTFKIKQCIFIFTLKEER